MAFRLKHMPATGLRYLEATDDIGRWTGKVMFVPSELEKPLRWKKPRRIFVCSMGDIFHPSVPTIWIDAVLEVIDACPQHTFLLLTKRADLIEEKLYGVTADHGCRELGGGDYLPNLWLGVTVCHPNERWKIEALRRIPAAQRWVSFEPLLWDMGRVNLDGISWVVAGAETGPGARRMPQEWARGLRDQCVAAGTPFFFKKNSAGRHELAGRVWEEWPA
jgi:protein gp37